MVKKNHDNIDDPWWPCRFNSWIVIPIIFIVKRSSQVSDPWTEDARWCRRVVVAGRPNENSEIVGIHLKPKRRPKLRVPVFRMKIYASLKPNENLKKVCSAPPRSIHFIVSHKVQYNAV